MAAVDWHDAEDVTRRLVSPILSALFKEGEVETVTVRWWHDRTTPYDESSPAYARILHAHGFPDRTDGGSALWLQLVVRGETFTHQLMPQQYDENDPDAVAVDLIEALEDWIPETRFAWGERRLMNHNS